MAEMKVWIRGKLDFHSMQWIEQDMRHQTRRDTLDKRDRREDRDMHYSLRQSNEDMTAGKIQGPH